MFSYPLCSEINKNENENNNNNYEKKIESINETKNKIKDEMIMMIFMINDNKDNN